MSPEGTKEGRMTEHQDKVELIQSLRARLGLDDETITSILTDLQYGNNEGIVSAFRAVNNPVSEDMKEVVESETSLDHKSNVIEGYFD